MRTKSKKTNLRAQLAPALAKQCHKTKQPTFVEPMLATLTENYFSSKDWFYEHKFDGERCLAFKKNGIVHLVSRNGNDMNASYPELVIALEKQQADNFIIDGEIITRNESGLSDFQLLQERINVKNNTIVKQKKIQIVYCIFDLMYSDGYDIRKLPLYERKKLLKNLLSYNKTLAYTKHTVGNGIALFKKACVLHWEGLIAKKSDSEYTGTRSLHWLKFKCIMKQELVIGGYTQPKGARTYFGALLVGYYKNKKLYYAGKVGTGFSEATLSMLGKKLRALRQKECPFTHYANSLGGVHWVKPVTVAEFEFAQWTKGGKLRVGRYKGLRDDKDAKLVVKETPRLISIPKKRS